MNLTKYFKLQLILPAIILFATCTKEVEPPAPPSSTDYISGKTVRYTVLVVPGGGTSFKSTNGIDSAIVSLVMNDSIYKVATDTTGLAAFNNLAAGIAAVTVSYPNHTTANLIVDLAAQTDTGYDSNNLRNASTMVVLFPLSGKGTANISGRVFANLDATNATIENAPTGLQITAVIEKGQLINYSNHTGDGQILQISYENMTTSGLTDANSDYSLIVPATGSGLKIVLTPNDFVYDQITASGPQRKVFKAVSDTITVISGVQYYQDIQYN